MLKAQQETFMNRILLLFASKTKPLPKESSAFEKLYFSFPALEEETQ
jgi:hypothetical protein